jgi:branched-chain amino acid transport system permease protein
MVCSVLARSPFGRTFRTIRSDEIAAMAIGKNPLRFRLEALICGAIIASTAGSLWAHYVTFVVPDQFTAEITFSAWIAMIVGGIGSMSRSIMGAAILALLFEGTRFIENIAPSIEGARMAAFRQTLIGLGLIVLTVRESRRNRT